jgi:hypothetical protein
MTLIWSVTDYHRTPADAAEEFALTYWDRPRRLETHPDAGGRFRMADGAATYLVVHNSVTHTYEVYRE